MENLIKRISGQKWRKRGKWHHSVICDEIFNEGESTTSCRNLGYPFERSIGVWLTNGDYLDLEKDWINLARTIRSLWYKDPKFLEKHAKHCMDIANDLLVFAENLRKRNAAEMSDEDLANAYISMVNKQILFMPFMFSVHGIDEVLTQEFEKELKSYIKKKNLAIEDYFKFQTTLTYPYRKIFVLQEKEDLLKLAVRIKNENLSLKDAIVRNLLNAHKEEYSWINGGVLEKLPYTYEEFEKRLEDLLEMDVVKEYAQMQSNENNIKAEQKKCMKEISSNQRLVEVSRVVQVYGFLRSYRVDAPYKAFFKNFDVLVEIAKRLSLDFMELKYLDSKEMKRALLDPKAFDYRQVISERKKGFVSVRVDDDRYELSGRDMDEVCSHIKLKEEKITGIVKGSTAYPGKITGKCKVLFSLHDMEKVKKGDILVISMTDPNYIPAMDRAAAFVTDQGGILCHAAIVSREMKKPCIIGTKIATKAFKDGDILEVDAERGIIKKL